MSGFPEEGRSAPLDEQDVFDRVGDSPLGHLRMNRSLDQITARGYIYHRRRTALTAMAGVAAITALGATVTFAQSRPGMHAVSTADGTAGAVGTATSVVRMTDPDWRVTAASAGGYLVDVTELGDVARLNATLQALGIEFKVAEATPDGVGSACATTDDAPTSASPSSTFATSSTSVTSTMSTTSAASTGSRAPTPTQTPVSFAASGTPAAFTFGALPKGSTLSFTSIGGRTPALLGVVRISDECLPVFGS